MNKPIHQGPDQLFPSNQSVAWLANQAVRLRADDKDIASDPPISVVTLFKLVAEEFPEKIALVDSYDDVDDIYTYKRYYESVTHVAMAFIKLGLKSYHGVGIIGFNAAPWFISYLGTIFAGGLAGGIHRSSSKETFSCLADIAECNIIIVEDDELLQTVLQIADDLPHLKAIIQYRGKPKYGAKNVYSWDEILEMEVDECEEEFQRRLMDMAPNKCCTLIATSGTTGKPKWVMLSHDNLIWNVKSLLSFINENEKYPPDTQVSYQTLSHVSAFLFDIYWPILCKGGTVIIAKRDALKGTLIETLRKAKPTFFVGIPKVMEMIMNSFLGSEINNNAFRKKCFSWAVRVSQQSSNDFKSRNKKTIKSKIAKHFFLKRMASRLGFDKCRFALVGASSCKQEVLEFFLAMGIPLMECYGMSEGGCLATNLKSCFKVNSVGQMVPGVQLELKQVFDGEGTEVCLFGRNMFMGYLKDEQRSKEAFDESQFFHTSDLGKLDENGMLNLVGRLNDVIIMRDSRKVLPLPIEKRILDQMPCLSYCVLVGEGRDFINALLVFKITWTLQTFIDYVNEGRTLPPDTVVSYLPLSHAAALLVDVYWTLITGGGTTYFARPDALKGSLVKSLMEARPTTFFGVPRVWEKFMEATIGSGNQVNHKEEAALEHGEPNSLDKQELCSKLGLDRCRLMLVGSAPCKREVIDYFWACGLKVFEIYGLSESTGPQAMNDSSNFKIGSVGKTITGFRTKFKDSTDEGGEICLDGRHVFMGYLNNEAKTRESFDEECWLRSGDVGKQDDEGFITITGRIKELIITAGGENIAPVPIEDRVLRELPCVSQCMLVGEKKKFLSMLLTLKTQVDPTNGRPTDDLDHSALEWCRRIGSNATKVSEILTSQDPLIMNAVQKGIDKANEEAISRAQCIQKWMILPHDFSMIGGELGPTLKMKRNEICKIYQNEIESFY